MIRDIDNAALGQEGSILISDTDTVAIPTGYVAIAISFGEETQFKALTWASGFPHTENVAAAKKESDGTTQSNAITWPQGHTRYGRWTGNITLWKGVVDVYLAKELKE